MRLAHFGTFDVSNYGDLLFPLIAEHRLGHMFEDIVHVSPIGGRHVYSDVPVSRSIREAIDDSKAFDAVLVGGGNILHAAVTSLPDYKPVKFSAYTDLWMGAAQIARSGGAPLAFNAPGAPSRFLFPDQIALRTVLQDAAYVSVRDVRSAQKLPSTAPDPVSVVPDSALQICDVLPYGGQSSLDDIALHQQISLTHGEYVAVHVNSRYGYTDLPSLASELDRISQSVGLPLCLIAIGPCHGDDVLVRELRDLLSNPAIIFDQPSSVTSIAHAIAGSRFYVGSSMHGFISATSYGVPAYLVVDQSRQFKFSGLTDQLDVSNVIFSRWMDFHPELLDHSAPRMEFKDRHPQQSAALDAHWDRIMAALSVRRPADGTEKIQTLRRVIATRNRAKSVVQRFR